MAVLTRTEVSEPVSIGLQPATREYVDLSTWPEQIDEPSVIDVANGLLEGRYDSGLTLSRFAEEHPHRLEVVASVGHVIDPWLVYAREATCGGGVQAWPDSPAAELYRIADAARIGP
jgi:hypothetical protein